MCNLIKKIERKTVTVYKVVISPNRLEGYYACFSGVKIVVGKVKPQTNKIYDRMSKYMFPNDYTTRNTGWSRWMFSENMVGKSSGFAKLSNARKLRSFRSNYKILKIVLGGEIWEGDASRIGSRIRYDERTFAGTEILSFEEVK
jgi:hypothetical protein